MQWFDSGEPLDPCEILNVERQLKIELPVGFREMIRSQNTASPLQTNFEYDDPKFGIVVGNFGDLLSFREQDDHSVIEVISRLEDRLPNRTIPFATTGDGGYLCLDYRTAGETPPVVLWLHEREVSECLVPVAESFEEFTGMLYAPEE